MNRNQNLIRKIVELEKQLHALRLELKGTNNNKGSNIEVGHEITLLNPKGGQGNRGIVQKVNKRTKRATVMVQNDQGQEQKIVRIHKNVQKTE